MKNGVVEKSTTKFYLRAFRLFLNKHLKKCLFKNNVLKIFIIKLNNGIIQLKAELRKRSRAYIKNKNTKKQPKNMEITTNDVFKNESIKA
jgi:hypothetical protein